jgi:hypothetical protein
MQWILQQMVSRGWTSSRRRKKGGPFRIELPLLSITAMQIDQLKAASQVDLPANHYIRSSALKKRVISTRSS